MEMKLVSWNVNGLRACMGKGFAEFFAAADADVFCVQETKMQPEQAVLEFAGYRQYWNSAVKKGYSGTAVFSRQEPVRVAYGLGQERHDQEGRLITLEFPDFFLVNVYTPNSQRGLARLEYRLQWEADFHSYLQELDRQKAVVLCGDLNVAHQEIDIKNPAANRRNAGFTDEEREQLSHLLDMGFVDSFRYLYPEQRDAYTWWSYMMKARERNIGWRIDYFLLSERWKENIAAAGICSEVLGSDHCPVVLELRV